MCLLGLGFLCDDELGIDLRKQLEVINNLFNLMSSRFHLTAILSVMILSEHVIKDNVFHFVESSCHFIAHFLVHRLVILVLYKVLPIWEQKELDEIVKH